MNIFIDNKYTIWYNAIIQKAKLNQEFRCSQARSLFENHHIIPESFFKHRNRTGKIEGNHNSKNNLILFY